MKRFIVALLLGMSVLACEPKLKPEKPDHLIPKDKMTEVLYDMFVVNAAKGINRRKLELEGLNPEQYILQKHSIDSVQFAKSNDYYAHDIEAYSEIIETVKKRLTIEKDRFEAINKEEEDEKKRKRDSLHKLRVIDKDKKGPVKNRASNRPKSN